MFLALNRQKKKKNTQPRSEKQYSYNLNSDVVVANYRKNFLLIVVKWFKVSTHIAMFEDTFIFLYVGSGHFLPNGTETRPISMLSRGTYHDYHIKLGFNFLIISPNHNIPYKVEWPRLLSYAWTLPEAAKICRRPFFREMSLGRCLHRRRELASAYQSRRRYWKGTFVDILFKFAFFEEFCAHEKTQLLWKQSSLES